MHASVRTQAVNQWVDENGLPEREEEKGGPKVPYERFHCEAVKHATLHFADPRKHKTWAHKFHSIKVRSCRRGGEWLSGCCSPSLRLKFGWFAGCLLYTSDAADE